MFTAQDIPPGARIDRHGPECMTITLPSRYAILYFMVSGEYRVALHGPTGHQLSSDRFEHAAAAEAAATQLMQSYCRPENATPVACKGDAGSAPE